MDVRSARTAGTLEVAVEHQSSEHPTVIMQTVRGSLIEAVVTVLVGTLVSLGVQLIVFPMYGIHVTWSSTFQILGWFTLAAIVSNFCVRRTFNLLHSKS